MRILALFPIKNMTDALLASLFAILMVFLILALIIFISWLFTKGIQKYEITTQIKPRPENEILNTDEDAVIASLVATIEFNKETGKDAHLVKIERVDD